jgi:hypothetical protein
MKDIRKKLIEHKLIITQSEKGKPLVTVHEQEDYKKIANDFICKTQFTRITRDPIKQHQNNIK